MYDYFWLQIFLIFIISIAIWIFIGSRWSSVSDFFHNRYSFFETSFVFLYFFEQIILTLLIHLKVLDIYLVVGLSSIIIITIASLQNKCWESRAQKISREISKQGFIMNSLKNENQKVRLDNKTLNSQLRDSKEFNNYLFKELEKLEKERKDSIDS